MKLLARHLILVKGQHYEDCRAQIDSFFEKTTLVQYDKISIDNEAVVNGDNDRFAERLKNGLEGNQAVLAKFIDELKTTGFERCNVDIFIMAWLFGAQQITTETEVFSLKERNKIRVPAY